MRRKRIDAEFCKTIVLALMRHLREHPLASDTPGAIARWWLGGTPCIDEGDVLQALEWMERHDLVERVTAPDGRVRFRRPASPPFPTR